jgi:signal transduction histidine kinase/CheY-like chemotaxis protein
MKFTHTIDKDAPLSSISSRLFLTVCSYSLIILVFFSVSLYYFQKSNYIDAHKKSYNTILSLLSENLKAALSFNDILAANKILEATLKHHQIESLTIIKNDNIWAQAGNKDFSPQYLDTKDTVYHSDKFIARKDISMHRQSLGQIILIANASSLTQIEKNIIILISVIGVFTLLLLKLVHLRLNALLGIRLKKVTQILTQINPAIKQAPVVVAKQANDEIGLLVETINRVVESFSSQQLELSASLSSVSSELKNSKLSERALRNKCTSAEQSSKNKSQFIANLTQELKLSTSDISGYIELISDHVSNSQVDNEAREAVKLAKNSTQYLLTLISDILDLSQAESGALQLNLIDCYLVDIMSQTVSIVEPIIAKNHNKITLHGDLSSIKLYTDAIKLRQALTNIIANAAQFTDNGQITVSAYQFEDNKVAWLKILIKDTGLGIERQQLSGLFRAYLQADHTTDKQRKGGFGLALSKTFIEMMGGIISVASEPNQGTIFELDIPVSLEKKTSLNTSIELPNEEVISPNHNSSKLVLFVSNNQKTINKVMINWVDKQTQVQHSESISIARKQLHRFNYNVLVVDSDYGIACWNFIAEVKSDIQTNSIPIIVLGKQGEFEKAIMLGADEMLIKPVNINRLNLLIQNYIEMDHA